MADTGGLPRQFDPRQQKQTGLDVLRDGLPELPAALTYDMSVPLAFWEADTCAVVLFLRFSHHQGEPPTPLAIMGAYYRQGGEWIAKRLWIGHGWSPDPVTDPGSRYDLDGRGGQARRRAGQLPAQLVFAQVEVPEQADLRGVVGKLVKGMQRASS